jgi:hypothetical protein
VRQWREERSKAREGKSEVGKGKGKGKKMGKKKKGKKKGKKGKSKGASPAAAIEGEPPHEPAGGEAEGAAAGEEAAAADADGEHAQEGESQPPGQEDTREECAICLQDLQLEDDEEASGDEGEDGQALVVLRCGHRFHEMCGEMWCAKCADTGWGVTCPRCRASYVLVQR